MPFTAAHPALVLPLLRWRYFSATGLIVGSISPDFEYFFKMSVHSRFSHTLGGLFYFDLPVTLALSLVFHQIIKKPLIDNLPSFISERFSTLYQFDFIEYLKKNKFAFGLSALLGAGSHLLWDSFTHTHGFIVQQLPFFVDTIVPYDGARYPLYYTLQHLSTLVGLLIMLVHVFRFSRQPVEQRKASWFFWPLMLAIASVLLVIRFWGGWQEQIGNQVVSVITALCAGLVISSWWVSKTLSHG